MEHEIKIEERETESGIAVDLIINGKTIDTGNNPISSFAFFDSLKREVRRAIFRIKTKNPKLKFDFNLSTMGLSKEEKNQRFVDHIKSKRPDVDVDKAMKIINDQISKIKPFGADDNHPNPECEAPIDCDLVKFLVVNSIGDYIKNG